MRPILKGSTDQSVVIRIVDSGDGTPELGVVFNTSGIDLWYRREGAAKVSITEATLSALTDAHSDGGVLHIGDGDYRLDLPDAAVATGANGVKVGGTVTGMVVIGCYVPLVDVNPYDAVRMGMTALPNAAAEAAGGLYTRGTGAGQLTQTANGELGIATLAKTVTTYTGNTVQTGDAYAVVNSGAHGNAALKTLVDDIPTNAELATSQAAADDATIAAIAALNNLSAAGIRTAVGLASANLDTQLGDLPTNAELATSQAAADDATLAAIAALNNLSQANIRTALGLASANLDTQLDAVPTNAELATALGTADDAILASIAALNNLSSGQVSTAISSAALATAANLALAQAALDLVKAQTDKFTFTVANVVDANARRINGTVVNGDGAATPWGP